MFSARHVYIRLMKTDFESCARPQGQQQRVVTQWHVQTRNTTNLFLNKLIRVKIFESKSRIIKNS